MLLPAATHKLVHVDGLRIEPREARFSVGDAEAIAALEAGCAPDRDTAALALLPVATAVAETLSTWPNTLAARQDAPAVERLPACAAYVSQNPTHRTQ